MLKPSIRWQLPLSYALIAFVATLILGAVLLTVLRDHYARQEYTFLERNAVAVSQAVGRMWTTGVSEQALAQRVHFLSMLPQTRIIVQDVNGEIVADSGEPSGTYEIRLGTMPTGVLMVEEDQVNTILFRNGDVPEQFAPPDNLVTLSYTPFGPIYNASMQSFPAEHISPETFMVRLNDSAGQAIGSVTVSGGLTFGQDILGSVTRGWLISCAVAVALAGLVGWWVSLRLISPLVSLTETTQKMAAGDLTVRSNVNRRDEVGVLAESFNEMAARIETSFNTLRRFAADAAHEICTPLTALHTNLELIEEQSHATRQALAQVVQLEALTRDLLDLSRIEAAQTPLEPVDVLDLIQQISPLYASRAEQADLDFLLHLPPEAPIVSGSRSQLKRMLCNLLDNAIKFTPAGGQVVVSLAVVEQQLEIRVQDSGIGIPDGDLPYLFERFRRGSNTAAYPGSGLGLAIVKAIASAHHASVSAENTGGGTVIRAVFPVRAA